MIGAIVRLFERAAVSLIGRLERLDHPLLNRLLRLIRERGFWQFVRFLAVGSVNFAFYYSIFTALHLLHMPPTQSVVIATVVAVLFNFCTTGQLVFRNGRFRLLPTFVGVYAVQMLLNISCLRMLIVAGVPVLVAEALVIGVLAVLTFFALKRFVFSEVDIAQPTAARPG